MAQWWNDRDIPLLLWILLVVVIIITMVFTLPKILGFMEAYQDMIQPPQQESIPAPRAQRALVRADQGSFTAKLTGVDHIPPASSLSIYDRLVTSLLLPPTLEELSSGYLSLIPEGTRYIGSQVIRRTLYLELSGEFFDPHPLGEEASQGMMHQLLVTLSQAAGIDQVLLIHDKTAAGEPITLPRQ